MSNHSFFHNTHHGHGIDIFRKQFLFHGHLPKITTLTLILPLLILSIDLDPIDIRKSCKVTTDCLDPTKECRDGFCHCLPFYDDVFDVSSGLNKGCMKTYLSNCNDKNKTAWCNTYKHLHCVYEDGLTWGTCLCSSWESIMEYDPVMETCAAIPGAHCDLGDHSGPYKIKCVSNAKCKHDDGIGEDDYFFGKCKCSKGYVQSKTRCVPELGAKCELRGDCDQIGMECVEGTCRCNSDRFYDEVTHECKIKAGRKCEGGNEDEVGSCVEGASCFPGGDMGWICLCNSDYHRDKEGNCRNITDASSCGQVDGEIKVYDEKRKRCSIKIGGQCKTEGTNLCVSHAFCGTGSRCQCFVGYRVTADNFCEKEPEKNDPASIPDGLVSKAEQLISLEITFLFMIISLVYGIA